MKDEEIEREYCAVPVPCVLGFECKLSYLCCYPSSPRETFTSKANIRDQPLGWLTLKGEFGGKVG